MALYVGVDPSLRSTGLAILDAEGQTIAATSFLQSVSERVPDGAGRLWQIAAWVVGELRMWDARVARVCIEGPSLGSTHREFDLGECTGAIKAAIYHSWPVEPVVVEPSRLKLFATGQGLAKKEEVLHAVKTAYGVDFRKNDDAADAFMLARLAWSLDHPEQLTRRCELEIVRALNDPKPKRRRLRASKQPNL